MRQHARSSHNRIKNKTTHKLEGLVIIFVQEFITVVTLDLWVVLFLIL